ncbi:hypothetical protein BpHYR1_010369 [Brachionus plicatilis]|uniref:Uncharacterized protein n=1 Tax=Brachionus plicatilis TaxID=10195 RepID=A0A3M7Q648_BRAPC|nr:hypothetical protein BpHYR1_010369 [Brachionus plicatilis]
MFEINSIQNNFNRQSRFLECYPAWTSLKQKKLSYNLRDAAFDLQLNYVKGILRSKRKEYWLTGYSLLSWYRECGLAEAKDLYININSSKVNKTHLSFAYNINGKTEKKITGTITKICSAEIFERKHQIPCDYLMTMRQNNGVGGEALD